MPSSRIGTALCRAAFTLLLPPTNLKTTIVANAGQ
jgi:hypothetical protein